MFTFTLVLACALSSTRMHSSALHKSTFNICPSCFKQMPSPKEVHGKLEPLLLFLIPYLSLTLIACEYYRVYLVSNSLEIFSF